MLIGKDWKIESDKLNVTLSQRHTVEEKGDKPKHDVWVVEGYFSSLKEALRALVNVSVRETELKDLKTITKKQDELYKLIENLEV